MTPELQLIPLGNKGSMKGGCESVLNWAYVNMEGIPSWLGTISVNLFILCREAAVSADDADVQIIMAVWQRAPCEVTES